MGDVGTCIQDLRSCFWGSCHISTLCISINAIKVSNWGWLFGDIQHNVLDSQSNWCCQICYHSSPSWWSGWRYCWSLSLCTFATYDNIFPLKNGNCFIWKKKGNFSLFQWESVSHQTFSQWSWFSGEWVEKSYVIAQISHLFAGGKNLYF